MSRTAPALLALAFALAHLPYLANTLEDIDSVNFALGVRQFDVAEHRPHPPGYPVYIALGKLAARASAAVMGEVGSSRIEARALSVLSLIGALVALLLLYRLLARLPATPDEHGDASASAPLGSVSSRALAATALTAACPLFWYLAVRPLSDVSGFAAATAAQACLALAWWLQRATAPGDRRMDPGRTAWSGRMIVLGAFLTAVAIGFRMQNALLTTPFLLVVLLDRIGRGFAGAFIGATVALTAGTLAWAVPLVVASGGWNAYLAALGSQAGEDFASVQMLYLDPGNARLAASAVLRTFIYPWDSFILGGLIVATASVGVVALGMRARRTLAALALLVGPYLGFHLLFQDTNFVRYSLPIVPVVAYLAVCGAELLARRAAPVLVGAAIVGALVTAAPNLAAYGRQPSPVARALTAMQERSRANAPGALALHQTFRRPLQAEHFAVAPQLPSPPRREWLELVDYWRKGNLAPLWFLADPLRTDVALFDPQSRLDHVDFGWDFASLSNLGGMRPGAVRWYRVPPPGWFVEQGWALTPETAGIARVMGRGPALGPINAWVRRRAEPARVLIGGRHLGSQQDPAVRFAMAVDGVDAAQWEAKPGFFLEVFDLSPELLLGEGLARLTVRSLSSAGGSIPTAIEQFDLQSHGVLMWGYEDGWHEAEYNATFGMFRWTSDRATLRVVNAERPLKVTLRVERPRRYFDHDPIVRLLAGGEVLAQTDFASSESWTVALPLEALRRSDGRVTIETTRTFVPADRDASADRRQLGLRVFALSIASQH